MEIHKCMFLHVGPSGVRALPLAAGRNECGHYFGPSGVRALPLAAGINEGGHYCQPQAKAKAKAMPGRLYIHTINK